MTSATHITIKEAAARYSLHQDSVRRAIKRGDLPALRITPRLIRIPVKALQQLWGS